MASLIIGIVIGMILGGGGTYVMMNNVALPINPEANFEEVSNVLDTQNSCTQLLKRQFEIQSSAPIVDGQSVFSDTEQNELAQLDEQISQVCGEISEERAKSWINGIVGNVFGNS